MNIEEIKDIYRKQIVWKEEKKGNQSLGIYTGAILSCYDIGFEIEISMHRSRLRNKELCMTFFELYLDEYINN
jgi:hypothetical protein